MNLHQEMNTSWQEFLGLGPLLVMVTNQAVLSNDVKADQVVN